MNSDIIIMDRESRQKCSIYPLSYRKDLIFLQSTNIKDKDFSGYLFLHVDGEELSEKDKNIPLVLLDASWRWALKIANSPNLISLPKRSITGFVTAYPRVSKRYQMPQNGLASVEALYISRLAQGREDTTLLDHYYWKDKFLQENQQRIEFWRSKFRQ